MPENSITLNNLPKEASFSAETGLFWNGKCVANFIPILHDRVEAIYEEGTKILLRVSLLFEEGSETEQFTIALEDLDETDWNTIDQRVLLSPDCSKAQSYLAYIVRSASASVPTVKEHHIRDFGTHIINGYCVFHTGDQIIWPPGKESMIDLVAELSEQKLVFDTKRYSEHEALTGMAKLLSLSPDVGRIITAHTVSGIMREAYIAAGVTPCSVIEIIGGSGNKKTTFVTEATQIFNRDKGIKAVAGLNSTVPGVEQILSQYKDCTVVIDDAHPAESGAIVQKIKNTFENIVRIVGNNTGRVHMNGGNYTENRPCCNVITTGEFVMGSGSTAARCLTVFFPTLIKNQVLHEFQREPLLVSTFYFYYISWLVSHYDEIQEQLAELLTDFRRNDLGVHPRLQETQFCLFTAYVFFLQYYKSNSFLTAKAVREEKKYFWSMLTALVKEQNKRVESDSTKKSEQADYLEIIRMLYKCGKFNLAKNAEKFKEQDGLIHNGLLCIRSGKLLKEVQGVIPTATLNMIRSALLAKEALKVDGEAKPVQVVGGKRFYGIYLDKLS